MRQTLWKLHYRNRRDFLLYSHSDRVSFLLPGKHKKCADIGNEKLEEGEVLIRIAIVDDEKVIREQIKHLIEKKQVESIIDTYSSGEKLLMDEKCHDIVFLDIQMDGMNGIEAARALRQKTEDTVLIFITGVKEYVFDAFDVAAFHYLIKPIEENKFRAVYDRAVLEAGKKKQHSMGQLFVKTRNRNVTLEQSDILYIESRAKKVEIHTRNDIVEAYAGIGELEKQLTENFYRCHRGYLVNMAFISEYSSDSIVLNNGETIILTKEKYGEFVKVYMRYLKNGGGIFV